MDAVTLYTQLAAQHGIVTNEAKVQVRVGDQTLEVTGIEADTDSDTVTLITA